MYGATYEGARLMCMGSTMDGQLGSRPCRRRHVLGMRVGLGKRLMCMGSNSY